MDAPPIQYARTEDGVNIAYWTLGQGPPLLIPPAHPISHIQLEQSLPPHAEIHRRYAERFRLICYDPRGSGLSDREVDDLSTEAHLRDLEAVVEAEGVQEFAQFGRMFFGPIALRYAATHPERISALVLWASPTVATAAYATGDWKSLFALVSADWQRAIDAAVRSWGVISDEDLIDALKEWWHEPVTQQAFHAFHHAQASELGADLGSIRAPTLIVHRPGVTMIPTPEARALAASIPNAHLALSEASSTGFFIGGEEETQIILDFLSHCDAGDADTRPAADPAVHTLLFTDLESSTELTRSLGDDKAQEVLRGHNESVRRALAANDGNEVKHTGDGIMASFASAVSAVAAALQIQRDLAEAEVGVRIGLNAGEPIAEDDDLFGLSVIKAARIADRADPGQVLVCDVIRQLCEGKRIAFSSIGEVNLKGFDEPVALYPVEMG